VATNWSSERIRESRPLRPSGWSRDTRDAVTSELDRLRDDGRTSRSREQASSKRKREATSGVHSRPIDCSQSYQRHGSHDLLDMGHAGDEEHDVLREVAHGLHYASLAMLGFLVLEVN